MTAQLSGHFYLYHMFLLHYMYTRVRARTRTLYILYVKGGYYMQRGG